MSTQPIHDDATPVPADTLRTWATRCFAAAGMSDDDAALLASSLVQTSLWGIDSHGVALLPHYLDRLANGTVPGTAERQHRAHRTGHGAAARRPGARHRRRRTERWPRRCASHANRASARWA